MCGRVIQSSGPLRYAVVDRLNVRDSRVHNSPPRWSAAPSQWSYWSSGATTRPGKSRLIRSDGASFLPVDGFYEWKAIKRQRAKQPCAIAMKDGTPLGIAEL
jgi:putative SOS response-associated peptidase YedK